MVPPGVPPSRPLGRGGTMGREVPPLPEPLQLAAPWLAELAHYQWARIFGKRELMGRGGVRAGLPQGDTLSLETLRRMLLSLLFTTMCVTEV